MTHAFEEGKEKLMNALAKQVSKLAKKEQRNLCAAFVRQCFGTVALEDLGLWTIEALSSAAFHFWSMIQTRKPHETKINIYNPTIQRDAWQSTHTIIEVITDDAPFLVDSIRMILNRMGFSTHLIIHMGGIRLIRNDDHEVSTILPRRGESEPNVVIEAPIFMEIDRVNDPLVMLELEQQIERVLKDTHAVVDDWQAMREKIRDSIYELDRAPTQLDPAEVEETKLFLTWIEDHHFTFLGIRDYDLLHEGKETVLQAVPKTGLGVLRAGLNKATTRRISSMAPEARALSLSSQILVTSKTNTLSTVHRDAYTDYIGVKRFNEKGQVIGERRILGLYTSAAYNTNPKHIPFLRHKVSSIMQKSLLNPRSHAGKVLFNILETFPRDDLIQASEDELLEMSMGIFHMQERRRIRLFARMDVYHRFISCLVYVPKDRFNTELRKAMQDVLTDHIDSTEITFSTQFTESVLARIHFTVRIDPTKNNVYDFKAIEKELIQAGRSWTDNLQSLLLDKGDEAAGNDLFCRYRNAFPVAYTTTFYPEVAVADIQHLEALSEANPLGIDFYRTEKTSADGFRLKLYQKNTTLALSDVLPILENLSMRAISERPYLLTFEDGNIAWINEFTLQYTCDYPFNIEALNELFQQAFAHVWFGAAENDGFNQLVLAAGLNWHEVAILRMYAKYFKQIGFTFSQDYIETALNNNPLIAKKLSHLFDLRFKPAPNSRREKEAHALVNEIHADLDNVTNLDEDKIIRQYIQAILATLRTNYYQLTRDGKPKDYISIKLNSKLITGVPRPHPLFEIFVYSPRFEGVHLRCSKVARGGLRWSDRREDFRTEILGLMKAQQVKNAVIVPNGAKGGFVIKQLPVTASREEILAEGIACYQQFISGLLDITDNYQNDLIVKPAATRCYDEDDPYLVVAADKGTATFSDIANSISKDYEFWLGDAFASGGSIGYDHKKMGITAKGAWESVKRHFYEAGVDMNTTDFTVVGIGDMAGDVFGNGMLLSNHIKLVAAFNHQHIFIDPTPDPVASLKERERLFHLPRSSWTDYNSALISKGGGVFNRNAKSIAVSKEMKHAFGIKQNMIEPNELLQLLLQAKVDLLWSAGIGTFVKSQMEINTDVGDRSNDLIRVNASQLRCRVVGEGGNLGFTQLARVEYALKGGLIFTDFIDNSAGVSCSDKEVNIKILLNQIVRKGKLTTPARNKLLSSMTQEVSALVLRENYLQTRAISLLATQVTRSFELHNRYLNAIELEGKLDRVLDFIPDEKVLMERKLLGKGLTTPDIAVLLCQSKISLKEAILASDIPEDPYLKSYLVSYFPKPLQERFSKQMQLHPLRREIISTKLSNMIVNEVGFSLVYRLQDETGASVAAIVRAYIIARAVLDMDDVWHNIEGLDDELTSQKQAEVQMSCVRLLRRTTRWFLRHKPPKCLDITHAIQRYAPGVKKLCSNMPEVFGEVQQAHFNEHYESYLNLGLTTQLSHELTTILALFTAMDMIEVAHEQSIDITKVAEVYFAMGEFLEISWIRSEVISHATDNHWEALSREALRDELDAQQQQLTAGIIRQTLSQKDMMACLHEWESAHTAPIVRWRQVLLNLRSAPVLNYTMLFVAVRELVDLTNATT
jgi:glutamate dehydrogenase